MKAIPPLLFLILHPTFVSASERLKLVETDQLIRVTLGKKTVLEYLKKEKPVPAGMKKAYRRSGYIHPVFSPGGQEVSGDFPVDHPHQHGLFFAWTNTLFEGRPVDFWNLAKEQGRVEFRSVAGKEIGEKQLSFSVRQAFVAGQGEDRRDVLHETWTVTVHETAEDHFLFDLTSEQKCAGEKPLVLPEYRYGGMAFRGNAQWLMSKEDSGKAPPVRFLTSEGKDRFEGNHSQPNWVAMTGRIDNKETTIVVMGHPANFRAPQPVRLHPEKPYFCFAPMVTDEFRIEPGQKYLSRYRYLVTSDQPDLKMIETTWKNYRAEAR
jgi:hypothetical protein